MKCDHVVLYNLVPKDKELEANRNALVHKYQGRGQVCHRVDHLQKFPVEALKTGTVGIYALCHARDMTGDVAADLVAQLEHANVKKINVACCFGATGVAQAFCTALTLASKKAKESGKGSFLKQDLLVCAFTIAVTTLELDDTWSKEELAKYTNPEEFTSKNRQVATVHTDRSGTNGEQIHLLHEKVSAEEATAFGTQVEGAFKLLIPDIWKLKRDAFLKDFTDLNKPSLVSNLAKELKIDDSLAKAAKQAEVRNKLKALDWSALFTTGKDCQYVAKSFVSKGGWKDFLDQLSAHNAKAATLWKSFDEYAAKKKAWRFDGTKFVEVALSKYTEQEDLKKALTFSETEGKAKGAGMIVQFMPHI